MRLCHLVLFLELYELQLIFIERKKHLLISAYSKIASEDTFCCHWWTMMLPLVDDDKDKAWKFPKKEGDNSSRFPKARLLDQSMLKRACEETRSCVGITIS